MLFTQLGESVAESIPQILLQSVFIVRTWRDDSTQEDVSTEAITLIFASIFASLMSISNKFIRYDVERSGTDKASTKAKLCSKKNFCFIISHGYLCRVCFRFFQVMARVIVYIMTWAVIGGWFSGIYLAIQVVIVWILFYITCGMKFLGCDDIFASFGFVLIILIAPIAADDDYTSYYIWYQRLMDDIIMMGIITAVSVIDFDCSLCADPQNRNFFINPSVAVFIVAGWSAIVLYSILMIIVKKFEFLKLV